MLQRYDAYYKAALLLKVKKKYNESVVYFYFSVLQLMMHSLTVSSRPIPLDKQNPLNEDLHKWILQELLNRMDNQKKERNFKVDYDLIAKVRNKADYQDESVSEDECLDAEEIYNRMKSCLSYTFKLGV